MNIYDIITNKIIDQLSKGTVPWVRPHNIPNAINYVNRKEYEGINRLLLSRGGEYLSFKQCSDLGGHIKKGSKAEPVVFGTTIQEPSKKGKKDAYLNDKGEYVKDRWITRYYNVFHIDDCEGIESKLPPVQENNHLNKNEKAQKIIDNYLNREGIKYTNENVIPHYNPTTDTITTPDLKYYKTTDGFYSTNFHECIHSTGHHSRLDRIKRTAFGSEIYSKEELVAEIGACFLNNKCGIESNFENNAAYIQNWLQVLRNDNTLIVKASALAQKAVNLILNNKEVGE